MKKIYFSTIKRLFFVASLFAVAFAVAKENETPLFFKEPLTEYKKPCWNNSGICNRGIQFLKDAEGNNFVLKHQKSWTEAIHDVLGARIGNAAGVPVNQTILLPTGTFFMEKQLEDIATLHTHVPGREVRHVEKMPFEVDIRNGLSKKRNLKSITESDDLARIVAANLYLNNNDGHEANTFFDKKTNRFYAIDQGNIFWHALWIYTDKKLPTDLLATKACTYVEKLRAKKLSPQQIKALKSVDKTLDKLTTVYPADKIYDEWMNIAQEANYEYYPREKKYIKSLVDYNCDEVKKLRSHIDTAISNQKISYTLRRMAEPSKKARQNFWHSMNS